MKRVVFDTWALVALLEKEEPAASEVQLLLQQAAENEVECLFSLINLGEIYSIVGRRHGKLAADETLTELSEAPIRLLSISQEAVIQAASFKMVHPISYADAFALSAATQYKATLITGDPELGRLSHLVDIKFLRRN
jgi:ribonuclease VapC